MLCSCDSACKYLGGSQTQKNRSASVRPAVNKMSASALVTSRYCSGKGRQKGNFLFFFSQEREQRHLCSARADNNLSAAREAALCCLRPWKSVPSPQRVTSFVRLLFTARRDCPVVTEGANNSPHLNVALTQLQLLFFCANRHILPSFLLTPFAGRR